jgi:hypothetical protein
MRDGGSSRQWPTIAHPISVEGQPVWFERAIAWVMLALLLVAFWLLQ